MKTSSKLKVRTAVFKGSFIYNPVLTQIIGICPILIAATSFKNALFISVILGMLLAINETLSSLLLKNVARYLRLCFYTVISAFVIAFIYPIASRLYPEITGDVGIYFYLLSLSGLIVIRCEKFSCKTGVRNSLIDAFATFLGYGTVALMVGTIRELLNYGTLFGTIGTERLPVVNSPFFALLLLGFLAALHRFVVMHFYPKELYDTFFMNEVREKPLLKDPGLSFKKEKTASPDNETHVLIKPRHSSSDTREEQK